VQFTTYALCMYEEDCVCAYCLNSQFSVKQYPCFLNVSEKIATQRRHLCTKTRYSASVTLKNTEALIDATKEVDIEVNAEKTKYTSMSCHGNTGQNHNIKKCRKVQIFGTDSNKSKSDLRGNACYHSVQNLLSFRLLYKKVKISNIQKYNFPCGFVSV
jgi:hypothetical protein